MIYDNASVGRFFTRSNIINVIMPLFWEKTLAPNREGDRHAYEKGPFSGASSDTYPLWKISRVLDGRINACFTMDNACFTMDVEFNWAVGEMGWHYHTMDVSGRETSWKDDNDSHNRFALRHHPGMRIARMGTDVTVSIASLVTVYINRCRDNRWWSSTR